MGHRIGHHRFHVLLAGRAIVPVEGVFGSLRRDPFGDVFDEACACPLAALELPAAAGAEFQAMIDVLVDPLGRLATRAFVSVLRPRRLLAPRDLWLQVDRPHPRRRGRQRRRRLQLGKAGVGRRQRQLNGLGPEHRRLKGLRLGQFTTEERFEQRVEIGLLNRVGQWP